MKINYDVVVIGAGSGGLTAAVGLSKIGKKVLLVEREHIGGECTNSGCIPSKALLHHAKTYASAVAISGTNGNTENCRRDAFSYVRVKIAETLSHETPEHFQKIGITVLMGEAEFTSKNTVTVGLKTYQFKKAIIATGSSPQLIEIPGLDEAKILTNQNIFNLESVPARTLIVGAGPIGMEMGQALALLGSKVTILDNGPTFAKLEDTAIQGILSQTFKESGITVIQNASIAHVEGMTAYIEQVGTTQAIAIPFDKILLAIGRTPNIPRGLGLAAIKYDSNGITVSKNYQTANKRVYALGDVADKLKFTHVADDVARGVVMHVATYGLLGLKTKSVPKVTYTEPEIAQVGLSQADAEAAYGIQNIHRIEVPFSQNDRARTDAAQLGVLIVIVTRLTGKILGAHIAGARAGELISIFTLAIDNNLSLWKLRRTIYAYPTYSLIIKKAGDYFFAQQITTLASDLKAKTVALLPKILLAGLWLFGLYSLYAYQQSNDISVSDTALALFDVITQSIWGPLLYILAYTIRPITFLPGTLLTILSGVFFGLYAGVIYTIIGANLSATFAYLIARFFSGSKPATDSGLLGRLGAAGRSNPFVTILSTRLLFLPYDAVNYGAGFLKIPFLPYILATIIGTLLGIVTFVAIGAAVSIEEFKRNGISLDSINSSFLLFSALIFIVSIGLAKIIPRK